MWKHQRVRNQSNFDVYIFKYQLYNVFLIEFSSIRIFKNDTKNDTNKNNVSIYPLYIRVF